MIDSAVQPESMPSRRRSSVAGFLAAMAVMGLGGCAAGGGAQLDTQAAASGPQSDMLPAIVAEATAPLVPLTIVPRTKPRARMAAATKVASVRLVEPTPMPEGYIWPVLGTVMRSFGEKANGSRSDGLDIQVAAGTPVRAAQAGVVAYAGSEIQGYGNMLLLTHPGGFVTVYAHNDQLLVHTGETVFRGQSIATVGRSGGVDVAELHFQLRAGERPLDPARHLQPGETQVASAGPDLMPMAAGE